MHVNVPLDLPPTIEWFSATEGEPLRVVSERRVITAATMRSDEPWFSMHINSVTLCSSHRLWVTALLTETFFQICVFFSSLLGARLQSKQEENASAHTRQPVLKPWKSNFKRLFWDEIMLKFFLKVILLIFLVFIKQWVIMFVFVRYSGNNRLQFITVVTSYQLDYWVGYVVVFLHHRVRTAVHAFVTSAFTVKVITFTELHTR